MSLNDDRVKTDIAKFDIPDAILAQLKLDTENMTIKDVNDSVGYALVNDWRKKVSKLRTKVENVRKELKADSLEYGRRIDAEAKRLTELILAIEMPLKKKEDWFTSENERIKREAEEAERKRKWEAEQAERLAAQKAEEERLAAERAKLEEERRKLEEEKAKMAQLEVKVTPIQSNPGGNFVHFENKPTPCQAHAVEQPVTTKQEESALCVANVMENEYDGMELADLLVDIMHYCDKQGLDAQQEWEDATRLYEQEK